MIAYFNGLLNQARDLQIFDNFNDRQLVDEISRRSMEVVHGRPLLLVGSDAYKLFQTFHSPTSLLASHFTHTYGTQPMCGTYKGMQVISDAHREFSDRWLKPDSVCFVVIVDHKMDIKQSAAFTAIK